MSLKKKAAFIVHMLPQGSSISRNCIRGAITLNEVSVILEGIVFGDFVGTNQGSSKFAAVKLDTSGIVLWRWQVMRSSLLTSTLRNDPNIKKQEI